MLSEIISRYAKCNTDKHNVSGNEMNAIRADLHRSLGNVEQKISIIESTLLYKHIPYDFNWREYLDLNTDVRRFISDEYEAKYNYELYGFHERRMYKKTQLANINTFIFCGGKCGGVTLFNTFKKRHIPCLHAHSDAEFSKNYANCGSIYDLMKRNSEAHETIYIIDSYRLPIERKISSFFQNITLDVPDYATKSIHDLILRFNYQYIYNVNPLQNNEDYHPMDEMLARLGVGPIEFKKTHGLLKHKNLVFIKLRFRDIDKWSDILSDITGKKLVLTGDNMSKHKSYSGLYEQFKKEYRVPKSYLEGLNQDDAFVTYNSPSERTDYVRYWMSRSE